jgi:hypothetical protein
MAEIGGRAAARSGRTARAACGGSSVGPWRHGKMDSGTLGMRVELPRLLSVLAHEVRGPLSVIQGYLRLMLKQRDPAHAETTMIRAMLDASGRLAAIGRQASEMALWIGPAPPAGEVALAALAEKAASLVPSGGASIRIDEATGREIIRASDADALAAALATLAELTARDTGGPIELSARAAGGRHAVTFLMTPAGHAASPRDGEPGPARGAGDDGRRVALAFDRGGFGLSLVLASYVLDAHGAVARADDARGGVEVELQKAGGSM